MTVWKQAAIFLWRSGACTKCCPIGPKATAEHMRTASKVVLDEERSATQYERESRINKDCGRALPSRKELLDGRADQLTNQSTLHMPTTQDYRWHVFVSHNFMQKPWVRLFVKQWRDELKLDVFFDEDSMLGGTPIDAGIEDGLTRSRHIVLFVTKEALASQWVAMETSLAIAQNPSGVKRNLIPVLLEDVDRESIPLRISRLAWVNLAVPGRRRAEYLQLLKSIGWTQKSAPPPPSPPRPPPRLEMRRAFDKSGLSAAFRIPMQDPDRQKRVKRLIDSEGNSEHSHFRLLASSGFNYVHPMGWVWRAGLHDAVCGGGAKFDIVLQSPFSEFGIARALACGVYHHHWQEKLSLPDLLKLARTPNVQVRVTEHPANCSLFFTKKAVLYDPYLWALPYDGGRIENNFWVFEFTRAQAGYDCYSLLEKHFDFHFTQGMPLDDFLGTSGKRYDRLTNEFERKLRREKKRLP